MIHQYDEGVYLYIYSSLADNFCVGDEWYKSVEDAKRVCKDKYEIGAEEWQVIDDPIEGCQGDWLNPVRIKGRDFGNPEWGKFERFENGSWKDFNQANATFRKTRVKT